MIDTNPHLQELSEIVPQKQPESVVRTVFDRGELTFYAHAEHIQELLRMLRDDAMCGFEQLIDLCGVDYPQDRDRFEVVYHLLSINQNARVRVCVRTAEGTPIPSVRDVYPNADWYEREAFDLYGVVFSGHPDMRRLLTDYGFEGYPLRKDFPLTGFVEVRYDEEQKRVVYEPVELQQAFRDFDFLSPWEGMTTELLPGDEKAEESKDG